jgi:hypothetical protein
MSYLLKSTSEYTKENSNKFSPFLASDRREENYDQGILWEELNLSQQFSVCSLGQFGYILTYVRHLNETTLAILKSDNKIATINEAGDINVSPSILFR